MDERLEEIRARVDAATEGPWWNETHVIHTKHPTLWTEDSHSCIHVAYTPLYPFSDDRPTIEESMANAEFLAEARQDIPWLLEQLTQAQGRIAELEKQNSDLRQLVNLGTVDWDGSQQGRIAELSAVVALVLDEVRMARNPMAPFEEKVAALERAYELLREQQPTTLTQEVGGGE